MNSAMNSSRTDERSAATAHVPASEELQIGPLIAVLWRHRLVMVGVPLLASALALGGSYLVPPSFMSRVTFLPPQQQQGGAASALASLGALTGIAGAGGKTNGDQYVSFAASRTVADRIVERFDLLKKYDRQFKSDARKELAENTRINLGKRDGLITLEVEDRDPQVAAAMAMAYVEEVRALTANLALTEAQQRRVFFEKQLKQVRDKLTQAQQALAATGINMGALKAEPKATAEGFAKLKAELTAAEVRLQVLRGAMAESTAEVMAQAAQVSALRVEIAKQGQNEAPTSQNGYITAYREYKYQELLFEQISRQYEIARIDESRDGGQLQVVDAAQIPERKSKPKRSIYMLVAFALTFILCGALVLRREFVQRAA
jgi:uncharacterized protein involved in exopolysaccharide biosynthesis